MEGDSRGLRYYIDSSYINDNINKNMIIYSI